MAALLEEKLQRWIQMFQHLRIQAPPSENNDGVHTNCLFTRLAPTLRPSDPIQLDGFPTGATISPTLNVDVNVEAAGSIFSVSVLHL